MPIWLIWVLWIVCLSCFAKQSSFKKTRPVAATHTLDGVRLGHIPGVYTSWKDSQLLTIGIRSEVKRFKTRKKALYSLPSYPGPASASKCDRLNHHRWIVLQGASAGGGVHIQQRESGPVDLWGAVIVDPRGSVSDWMGAFRVRSVPSSTQQLIISSSSNSDPRRGYNLLTNSKYCVRLFADNSIKGRCKKVLIAEVRRVLS